MGKHLPPAREIFAISKCHTSNPLINGWCGVVYTKHYIQKCTCKGKVRHYIIDAEIPKELAENLITKHRMTIRIKNSDGTLWDTQPSLQNECKRLGLTYTYDKRPY